MKNDIIKIAATGVAGVVCILGAWGLQVLANAVYGDGESMGRRIGASLIWLFSLAFAVGVFAGFLWLARVTWNAPVKKGRRRK